MPISGNQWQSVPISGNQWQSVPITWMAWSSETRAKEGQGRREIWGDHGLRGDCTWMAWSSETRAKVARSAAPRGVPSASSSSASTYLRRSWEIVADQRRSWEMGGRWALFALQFDVLVARAAREVTVEHQPRLVT